MSATSEPLIVRRYAPRDRAAVRHLCCDTATRGAPVEQFFDDREVFADFVTRYYTDYEPNALWVAEHTGRVIGYLSGCLDPCRYRWLSRSVVVPFATVKAIWRGALWSRKTWRLLNAGVRTWMHRQGRWRIRLDEYPAHLHLNIKETYRGQGVGSQLVARFIDQARAIELPGIHAAVRADNDASCRFFERMGFTEVFRCQVIFPEGLITRLHETILYGKQL